MDWIWMVAVTVLMPVLVPIVQTWGKAVRRHVADWFAVRLFGRCPEIEISARIPSQWGFEYQNPLYDAVKSHVQRQESARCHKFFAKPHASTNAVNFLPGDKFVPFEWRDKTGANWPMEFEEIVTPSLDPKGRPDETVKIVVRKPDRSHKTEREFWDSERCARALREFVAEADKVGKLNSTRHVTVHLSQSNQSAELPLDENRIASFDGVLLPEVLRQSLLADLDRFWKSQSIYRARGQPWKRGFLFSGPPGSGKTSLLRNLISFYGMNALLVNLLDFSSDDAFLGVVMKFAQKPGPKCVVFEDVDCVTSLWARPAKPEPEPETTLESSGPGKTTMKVTPAKKGVALNTFLNYMDGLLSPDETVFVLTANHPDKLDPALLRPGRVDKHFRFGPPDDPVEIARFCRLYLGSSAPLDVDEFAVESVTLCLSVAEICSAMQRFSTMTDESDLLSSARFIVAERNRSPPPSIEQTASPATVAAV